jgi:ABC-type siderophore export system fused ATPase/permease subunit
MKFCLSAWLSEQMSVLKTILICVLMALNIVSMSMLWSCLKGASDADDRLGEN